ncbi:hypothetical protein AN618_21460 [Fervidicola ferrireducens]|uniref:Uncharacterized protein n=1 Tax=Fervidicola ferrireducens TaxID=520764 RepID=A0A140L2S9_9FIRM|nr:hypothetical protein AN618_21460 [Fervidicola ferrireducens]
MCGQGTICLVFLELGAQGFVGRHGFTLEERLPAPVLDGVPEGSAAIPDYLKYLLLLFIGQDPDNVCSLHTSILAQLTAAFIPTLERVGLSRGGSVTVEIEHGTLPVNCHSLSVKPESPHRFGNVIGNALYDFKAPLL